MFDAYYRVYRTSINIKKESTLGQGAQSNNSGNRKIQRVIRIAATTVAVNVFDD